MRVIQAYIFPPLPPPQGGGAAERQNRAATGTQMKKIYKKGKNGKKIKREKGKNENELLEFQSKGRKCPYLGQKCPT